MIKSENRKTPWARTETASEFLKSSQSLTACLFLPKANSIHQAIKSKLEQNTESAPGQRVWIEIVPSVFFVGIAIY